MATRSIFKRINLFTITAILLTTWVSCKQEDKIKVGMTKPELVDVLGEPEQTVVQGTSEYLHYPTDTRSTYIVEFENGKVSSHGNAADYVSQQAPGTVVRDDAPE